MPRDIFTDMEDQYDKIYRYCYFRLRDRQTAEDVTQGTFLRYLENYEAGTADQALRCLYTIARNLCVDEYRRCSREQSWETLCASDDGAGGSPTEAAGRRDPARDSPDEHLLTSLAVRAAVAALAPDEQELLLLRYVNEVPILTLAQLMQVSRFAVYRRLTAVTKKFKEQLKQEGIE